MNLKKVLSAVLVAILSTAGTAMGNANFTVGVENINYYPQYTYENKEYKGYARELLDLFAKSKGGDDRWAGRRSTWCRTHATQPN